MQILTNKFNLPETIVAACAVDKHRVAGNISVSELIDEPQIRILKRLHDYEVDVSEKLDALLGTALHGILDQANISNTNRRHFEATFSYIRDKAQEALQSGNPVEGEKLLKVVEYLKGLAKTFFGENESDYLTEQTISVEVADMGYTLYGTYDLYNKKTKFIEDYKSCSVYKWLFPESRKQWQQQLNIYAWLAQMNGVEVHGLKIIAFFKDWNLTDKLRNKDYPVSRIMEIPIELRSTAEISKFVEKRLNLHLQAEAGEEFIPPCSGKARWAKGDMYVVKQKDAKRAINGGVFESEELALNFIEENNHKFTKPLFVDYRPGESIRCANYCAVSKFCKQREAELLERKRIESND